MTSQKPFAPACERNQEPILSVIKPVLNNASNVLEIGSGTGQHAVYFAEHMPWLTWQTSDVSENLSGIQMWIDDADLNNLPAPIELDVTHSTIDKQYDAIFSCNTLHIMSMEQVKQFFQLVKIIKQSSSDLLIYGPFNYQGSFTSDSNAQFDQWLKNRDSKSGIRDFEWINELAEASGFELITDHAMPANNRCLHWHYTNQK